MRRNLRNRGNTASVAIVSFAASSHVLIADDDAAYKTAWRLTHTVTTVSNADHHRHQSNQRMRCNRGHHDGQWWLPMLSMMAKGNRDHNEGHVRFATATLAAFSGAQIAGYCAVNKIA